jgi:hypothetical protein
LLWFISKKPSQYTGEAVENSAALCGQIGVPETDVGETLGAAGTDQGFEDSLPDTFSIGEVVYELIPALRGKLLSPQYHQDVGDRGFFHSQAFAQRHPGGITPVH